MTQPVARILLSTFTVALTAAILQAGPEQRAFVHHLNARALNLPDATRDMTTFLAGHEGIALSREQLFEHVRTLVNAAPDNLVWEEWMDQAQAQLAMARRRRPVPVPDQVVPLACRADDEADADTSMVSELTGGGDVSSTNATVNLDSPRGENAARLSALMDERAAEIAGRHPNVAGIDESGTDSAAEGGMDTEAHEDDESSAVSFKSSRQQE
jgi:hypothetical protein